jgi:hypothetical protein
MNTKAHVDAQPSWQTSPARTSQTDDERIKDITCFRLPST